MNPTMTLRFCDQCGSVLVPAKARDGSIILKCKCGAIHEPANKTDYTRSETFDNSKHKTTVLDADHDGDAGTVAHACPRCGHHQAWLIEIPPSWGDEESVYRYRCTRCNHTSSEGAGLGW